MVLRSGGGGGGSAAAPPASTTVAGLIEIATQAEVTTGTDATRAVTPTTLKPLIDAKADTADLANVATTGQYSDLIGAPTGGGSGAVDSVNGQTGVVVMDADDIGDGTTKVTMTTAERTKLGGVATGATANATDAALRDRATHTGTQAAATLADLTETVQDIVAAFIAPGTGLTASYDDVGNLLTLTATGGGGTTDPEVVRDTIGSALVPGSGIQITLNDVGDTITVASTAVLPTRQVIAGTGLSGGGDLSADRTLAVAYGATAGTAAQGNDSRLSDARTPTAHQHPTTDISDSTTVGRSVLTAADAAAARTAIGAGTSSLAIGTTGSTAAAGNDSRIVGAAQRSLAKRTVTGAYTLVLADATDMVMHSTAASAVTITLPQDSSVAIPQETAIPWRQYGAGQITFAAGTGATLVSRGSVFKSAGQYAEGLATKVAANTWLLSGDITA